MDLEIRVEGDGERRVVRLAGTCDLATVPALREALAPLLPPEVTEIVLDVGELDSMDDTGLGVVLGALRRQREGGGELRIAGARGPVRRALEVTGLADAIPLLDEIPKA